MLIVKGNGEQEEFRSEKLKESLKRAGAASDSIKRIVDHIEQELSDGMTTSEIYRHAFALLKKEESSDVAARYSLKRAVMQLGPSGFPFEKLLAEIFRVKGYVAENDIMLKGACVEHEIDLFARKDKHVVVGEAKFHNKPGFKTDLKVALYVASRFRDLREGMFGGRVAESDTAETWLVTNTKFTRNAAYYGRCQKLPFISWNYPEEGNLEELINQTGLHPLTCLTTLSGAEKQSLFKAGHVLCRDLQSGSVLESVLGHDAEQATRVRTETKQLCIPQ